MRVYLLFDSQKKIQDIEKANKGFDIDIVGRSPYSPKAVNEIALGTPDIVICDSYENDAITQLCQLSKNIIVIMLSNDENRAVQTQNELAMKKITNFNFINTSIYGYTQILSIIHDNFDNLVQSAVEDDGFEIIDEDADGNTSNVDLDNVEALKKPDEEVIVTNEESQSVDQTSDKKTEAEPQTATVSQTETKDDKEEVLVDNDNGNDNPPNDRFESVGNRNANEDIITGLTNNAEFDNKALIMRTKIVHIHSKKGGVGKSTIAKELAYVFSQVTLPKKVNRQQSFLKTCIVDFDLERGNLKTLLGFEQPTPNIYDWIDDIVTNMERGVKIESIRYNNMTILTRFVKKINESLFALITGKGEIPVKLFDRISRLESNNNGEETVLKEIFDKILSSLRGVFDVVMVDSGSEFDESTLSAFEQSDTNLIVVNPTIASFESAKEELEEINRINGLTISNNIQKINTNSLAVILNMDRVKTGIDDDIEEMLKFLKISKVSYEEDTPTIKSEEIAVAGRIAFDPTIINFENNCEFATSVNGAFKKCINIIGDFILPIFKHTATRIQSVAKIKKELARREAEKKGKKSGKKKPSKNRREDLLEKTITSLQDGLDNDVDETDDDNVKGDTLVSDDDKTNQATVDTVNDVLDRVTDDSMTIKEFAVFKFPKNITLDAFMGQLEKVQGIKRTTTGFPIIEFKPKYLPTKVYKAYVRLSLADRKKKMKSK